MNHIRKLTPVGIAIIYVLIASCWLLISDSLIESIFPEGASSRLYAHVIKGFFNVVWTGILIYVLTSKSIVKLSQVRSREEETNQRIAETFEHISDSFLSVDKYWNIVYVNRHLEAVFNESRSNITGKILWKAIPKFGNLMVRTRLEASMNDRLNTKFRFSNKEFSRELLISAYPTENGMSIYMQDLTELVKAEQQALDHEVQLQHLIDSVEDKIWSLDKEGNYTHFNRNFSLCYRSQTGKFPQVGEKTEDNFAKKKANENWEKAYHLAFLGKESSVIDILEENGKRTINEVRLNPIRDRKGEVISVMCIARDVTEKIINEQHLERQNELFDEIAWLTSHEIRGPVATIRGLLNIIDRDKIVSNDVAQMIENLIECSEQLDETIKSIIDKVEYAYSLSPSKIKNSDKSAI